VLPKVDHEKRGGLSKEAHFEALMKEKKKKGRPAKNRRDLGACS